MNTKPFIGTGTLIKFLLRRDRLRLSIWILIIASCALIFIPMLESMLESDNEKILISSMMKNPAMVAIVGPVYGANNYTIGAFYANTIFLFTALLAGVMNIFTVTRHIRKDEDEGRLEIIQSLPVGNLASLNATIIGLLAFNILLALIIGLGAYAFSIESMNLKACLLFGLAIGLIGIFFAAIAAVFSQLTSNSRAVNSLSLLFLFFLYIMRAAGDVGNEILSLISPLGLLLRSQPFVENHIWPLVIIFLITFLLLILTYKLTDIRDLGRGLIPEARGRDQASKFLKGPKSLTLKLLRAPIIIWLLIAFSFAFLYGSLFGEIDSFIYDNDILKMVFMADPDFPIMEQFIAMLSIIMAMIASLPALNFINRLYSEDLAGHTENLLGSPISRHSIMSAYLIPAFGISISMQALVALGFWSAASMVYQAAPDFSVFLIAALLPLPAVWVFTAFTAFLVGLFPRLASLTYVYLGYSFIITYIAVIVTSPAWMTKVTPFGYISKYPAEDINLLPLLAMAGIAIILTAFAYFAYNRRDIKT